MATEREIEIARKVQEVCGEHEWSIGDYYYSRLGNIPPEDAIWLPSEMDYMRMLWEENGDAYLTDHGVYELYYIDSEIRWERRKVADTPAEAWMKVVE